MADDDDADVVNLAGGVSPKKGPNPEIDVELGVSNVLPVGAWLSWLSDGQSDTATVVNTDPVSVDRLTEMMKKDGHARALYRLMALPILSCLKDASWTAPDDQEGGDDEAEFANLMFSLPPAMGGMSTPISKIMRQILRGIPLGYSPFEEVRYVPEDGPLAGKITMKKLAYREPRTIRFRVDKDGGYAGMRQLTQVNGRPIDVIIPGEKTWYWASNEEENPFYGISYFESAWYHYDIKKKLYYLAHLASQFAAVPGRIGTIPATPDPRQLKAFKTALQSFAFNTAMIAPLGYTVEPFNSNSQFDFMPIINHHNSMMSESVLGKFLDQEDRQSLINIENGGDANVDMFCMMLEAIMHSVAESWTYFLMPKYIDWNFGTGIYPVFKFGKLNDGTREAIQTMFTAMAAVPNADNGGNVTPEFVRALEKQVSAQFDLDIDYDEVEQREEQQSQEQEQEQLLQAQQAATQMQTPTPPGVPPGQAPAQQPGQAGGPIPPAGAQAPGGGAGAQQVAMTETGGGYISLSELAEEIERLRADED